MEQVRATCITLSFSGTQPAPDRVGGAEPAAGAAAGRGGGGCCWAEEPGARLEGAGRGWEGEREGAEQLCGQPPGGGGPGPGPEEPPAGPHPQVGHPFAAGFSMSTFSLEEGRTELVESLEVAVGKVYCLEKWVFSRISLCPHPHSRRVKEQEREAKLGEREQAELRSSNQYLLERLEQVTSSRTPWTDKTCHFFLLFSINNFLHNVVWYFISGNT